MNYSEATENKMRYLREITNTVKQIRPLRWLIKNQNTMEHYQLCIPALNAIETQNYAIYACV